MLRSIALLILLYALRDAITVPTACFVLTYISMGLNLGIALWKAGRRS